VPGRIARKALSFCLPLRVIPCVGLAALGLIVGTSSLQTVVANGDTRSITLQHTHRDDQITVTFKREGRYDEAALAKLNYFLRDWRNDEQIRMDPRLFDVLWEVYREVDAKTPIRIVSSYRSPKTNAMLRRRSRAVAQYSQHMLGKAIDFNIEGVSLDALRAAGMRLQRGGVGFYPGSFVHMDVGSVRHWPRMSHDQLVRVFPNGRTVHIPSDGQPLPGYALALADIEKRGSSAPSSMSLSAARNAGKISGDEVRLAANDRPKKGNVIAKLFGFSTDDDEDDETSAPGGRRMTVAQKTMDEDQPSVVARVPVPVARPARIEVPRKPGGGFALASASSTPFELPARTAPRPPAELTDTVASRAETTASINSWLNDSDFSKPDRVPPDIALAYAAHAMPDAPRPAAAPGAPAVTARFAPDLAATSHVARIPPRPGQRYNDPWTRAVTLATSVHSGMSASFYGRLDIRQVRMLMIKPASSVAMHFGAEPYQGMRTLRFSGAAVTFVPTVAFPRLASLQQ
jgi:uncharacterized protein YcbK (DUF882 family)